MPTNFSAVQYQLPNYTGFQSMGKNNNSGKSNWTTMQCEFNKSESIQCFYQNSHSSSRVYVFVIAFPSWLPTGQPLGLASAKLNIGDVKTSQPGCSIWWDVALPAMSVYQDGWPENPPVRSLSRSLLNLQTLESAVVAEHPLFMTLGIRVAADAALLCLDRQVEYLRGEKKGWNWKGESRYDLQTPPKLKRWHRMCHKCFSVPVVENS